MRRLSLVLALCVLALAGCKVDTTVSINVRQDGSGTVEVRVDLDAEAVAEAQAGGGELEDRVRLGDLEAAGWESTGWRVHDDFGATLRISKEFADPDDLAGVIDELNGDGGPLRDFALSVDEGALFTKYDVDGVVDLADLRTGVTADAELVAALTGEAVDVSTIDQRLLDQIRESLELRVDVSVPGESRSVTPAAGETVEVTTSSNRFDPGRPLLLGAAGVFVVLALLVWLRGRSLERRRRRRTRRRGATS
jgi:hypothetical protein